MGEKWMLPIYVKRDQIGAMIYCRPSLSLPEPIAVQQAACASPLPSGPFSHLHFSVKGPRSLSRSRRRNPEKRSLGVLYCTAAYLRGEAKGEEEERRGRGFCYVAWNSWHSWFFLLPLPISASCSFFFASSSLSALAASRCREGGGRHRRLLSATSTRQILCFCSWLQSICYSKHHLCSSPICSCPRYFLQFRFESLHLSYLFMHAETGGMDGLEGFEFFQIILDNSSSRLKLPDKFTRVLLDGGKPQEVKLREAGQGRRFWDVKVVLDADGHMYLGRGWEQFARAHDLRLGYFLVLSYDGDAVLTVKVFDVSMCRRHYKYDDGISSGSSSDGDSGSSSSSVGDSGGNSGSMAVMGIDDGPTGQFSAMLRKCNLGMKQEQYLNVPVDFQLAHGYAERSKVDLRMRGKSWLVTLKHSPKTGGRSRASFRYGWHQFCVDNSLGEGDTCFFRALRQCSASGGGEDHLLKVEVRKRDGSFLV